MKLRVLDGANPTVRFVTGPTILLSSGAYFDIVEPGKSAFTIEDIAHGLSNVCRFAGQCGRFYSVAQHSVHVSEIVPLPDAYAGLMHDASEAFIGDIAKPLKVLLPEYALIEDRVEQAIAERFGVAHPLPPSVKLADRTMLATEQRHLMNNRGDWDYTRGHTPLDMDLPVWTPPQAKAAFLARFTILATIDGGA